MSEGHARKQDRDFQDEAAAVGLALVRLDSLLRSQNAAGRIPVRGITLRLGYTWGSDTLITVKGWDDDGGPAVAFHSADTASSALRGAINRLLNGQLDWKYDEFYQG